MAGEMGITVESLERWVRRHQRQRPSAPTGRPEVIGAAARWRLRACYLAHYKQWGPQALPRRLSFSGDRDGSPY